jgi:hypothetical protein
MATLMEGDGLKRALKWLSEQRLAEPAAPRMKLIDEAARRFDLSPVETEFLVTSWREDGPAGG